MCNHYDPQKATACAKTPQMTYRLLKSVQPFFTRSQNPTLYDDFQSAWTHQYSYVAHVPWTDPTQLDPSSRLATTDMGRKLRGLCPLGAKLGPHLTQCGLGRGLPPYEVAYLIHPAVLPQ